MAREFISWWKKKIITYIIIGYGLIGCGVMFYVMIAAGGFTLLDYAKMFGLSLLSLLFFYTLIPMIIMYIYWRIRHKRKQEEE